MVVQRRSPNYFIDGFAPNEGFSFDAEAFDSAIRSQGVNMVHHRALICPLGITDKHDTVRREHPPHPGCSNGVLYQRVGVVRALFLENSASPRTEDAGGFDGSQARVTFPRFYDEIECGPGAAELPPDKQRIYVGTGDRFYLDERESDVLWLTRELVEHSISSIDRLRFPAVAVHALIDNRLFHYHQGIHFDIDSQGQICWKGIGPPNSPGIDAETPEGRGRVYTVWYLYRPYWYVDRIVHQGRPTQVQNGEGVDRKVENMGMEVSLTREVQYQNERAGGDPQNTRENRAPRDGSFT